VVALLGIGTLSGKEQGVGGFLFTLVASKQHVVTVVVAATLDAATQQHGNMPPEQATGQPCNDCSTPTRLVHRKETVPVHGSYVCHAHTPQITRMASRQSRSVTCLVTLANRHYQCSDYLPDDTVIAFILRRICQPRHSDIKYYISSSAPIHAEPNNSPRN
jgi:hypothetical protein